MSRPAANYWQDYPSGGTPRSAANLNVREGTILDYVDEKVATNPSAEQVVQPSADVVSLAIRAGATQTGTTALLEGRASDGTDRFLVFPDGSVQSRQTNAFFPNFQAFAGSADTEPTWQVNGQVMRMGPGGTVPTDVVVTRELDGASNPRLKVENGTTSTNIAKIYFPAGGISLTGSQTGAATSNSATQVPVLVTNTIPDAFATVSYASMRANAYYMKTNAAADTTLMYEGIQSLIAVGSSDGGGNTVLAKGTMHTFTSNLTIWNSTGHSEHANWVSFMNYEGGGGRAWITDFNVHGRITTQQELLSGVNVYVGNYYNGSPSTSPSYAFAAMTGFGRGGGEGSHNGVTRYPVDVGFWVLGTTGSAADGATVGFNTAFRAGQGSGVSNAGGWNYGTSRIGTGLLVDDYEVNGIHIASRKTGTGSAIKVAGGMDLEFVEGSAPSATSNSARIWAEDNGAGKTRLMVRFGTGANQQIAIEP